MGRVFHEMFPRFHYFHFFLNWAGFSSLLPQNFIAIAAIIAYLKKTSANTHGLQQLVDFWQVNSSIFVSILTIVDLYIPDFKRLYDTFDIVATMFVVFV
jgi:hypothetical protein